MGARVSLLLVFLFMFGCATPAPVPVDRFYRLPEAPGSEVAADLAASVIVVGRFSAHGIHRERAIVFSASADAVELQQHRYHYWSDSPTRMLRDHLLDFLRASSAAPAVSIEPTRSADLRLSARIRRLDRVIADGRQAVFVKLDFEIVTDNSMVPILVKSYSRHSAVSEQSVQAAVAEFGAALVDIYQELARDINANL